MGGRFTNLWANDQEALDYDKNQKMLRDVKSQLGFEDVTKHQQYPRGIELKKRISDWLLGGLEYKHKMAREGKSSPVNEQTENVVGYLNSLVDTGIQSEGTPAEDLMMGGVTTPIKKLRKPVKEIFGLIDDIPKRNVSALKKVQEPLISESNRLKAMADEADAPLEFIMNAKPAHQRSIKEDLQIKAAKIKLFAQYGADYEKKVMEYSTALRQKAKKLDEKVEDVFKKINEPENVSKADKIVDDVLERVDNVEKRVGEITEPESIFAAKELAMLKKKRMQSGLADDVAYKRWPDELVDDVIKDQRRTGRFRSVPDYVDPNAAKATKSAVISEDVPMRRFTEDGKEILPDGSIVPPRTAEEVEEANRLWHKGREGNMKVIEEEHPLDIIDWQTLMTEKRLAKMSDEDVRIAANNMFPRGENPTIVETQYRDEIDDVLDGMFDIAPSESAVKAAREKGVDERLIRRDDGMDLSDLKSKLEHYEGRLKEKNWENTRYRKDYGARKRDDKFHEVAEADSKIGATNEYREWADLDNLTDENAAMQAMMRDRIDADEFKATIKELKKNKVEFNAENMEKLYEGLKRGDRKASIVYDMIEPKFKTKVNALIKKGITDEKEILHELAKADIPVGRLATEYIEDMTKVAGKSAKEQVETLSRLKQVEAEKYLSTKGNKAKIKKDIHEIVEKEGMVDLDKIELELTRRGHKMDKTVRQYVEDITDKQVFGKVQRIEKEKLLKEKLDKYKALNPNSSKKGLSDFEKKLKASIDEHFAPKAESSSKHLTQAEFEAAKAKWDSGGAGGLNYKTVREALQGKKPFDPDAKELAAIKLRNELARNKKLKDLAEGKAKAEKLNVDKLRKEVEELRANKAKVEELKKADDYNVVKKTAKKKVTKKKISKKTTKKKTTKKKTSKKKTFKKRTPEEFKAEAIKKKRAAAKKKSYKKKVTKKK